MIEYGVAQGSVLGLDLLYRCKTAKGKKNVRMTCFKYD